MLIFLLALIPACGNKKEAGDSEVISKRVKIDLKDGSAPVDGSVPSELPPQTEVTPLTAPKPAERALPERKEPEKKEVAEAPRKPAIKIDLQDDKEAKKPAVKKASKQKPQAGKKASEVILSKSVDKAALSRPWALNIASFPSIIEAQTLTGKLKKAGYDAYITEFMKNGVRWHRVRVGFYYTRNEAAVAAKVIGKKLHLQSPWIVKAEKEEILARARR
ncbi:MAG: SPOR domain-containing protein [Deltaproteobacteria bacterium]|nr:SPOR domain-containing protein [Deltaproteobacteria bacterium]